MDKKIITELYVLSLITLIAGMVYGSGAVVTVGAVGAIVLQFFTDFWEKLLGVE